MVTGEEPNSTRVNLAVARGEAAELRALHYTAGFNVGDVSVYAVPADLINAMADEIERLRGEVTNWKQLAEHAMADADAVRAEHGYAPGYGTVSDG